MPNVLKRADERRCERPKSRIEDHVSGIGHD